MKALLQSCKKSILKTSFVSVFFSATIFVSMILCSCATNEFHRTPEQFAGKVLVGNFSLRNMDFDPFLVSDFKDILGLEFFKSGYEVKCESSKVGEEFNGEKISRLCQKFNCDYYVGGVISSGEMGFLLDREMQSRVSFKIFSSLGKKLGEASYSVDKSFADRAVQRDCAEAFVSEFKSKMGSPRK